MRKATFSLTLAVSVGFAAIFAACGGATPDAQPPTSPTASAVATDTPPPPATTSAVATSAPTTPPPADTTPVTPPPPAGKTMPDVGASTMVDGLKALGLDLVKLPKMSALTGAQRGKVMPLIVQATGYQCGDCHVQGNFKAETPRKQVARKMWDEFVVPDKLTAGPLFCDSCHKGQHDFLDRAHKDAVGAYMDAQYTKKLASKSGKDVACTNCHGSDMEMKIFEKLWKIKDVPHAEADAPKPVYASSHLRSIVARFFHTPGSSL